MTTHTEAEYDLLFLRDLKHRLRMTLREIEKREKQVLKEHKTQQRLRRQLPTQEQLKATLDFYKTIEGR